MATSVLNKSLIGGYKIPNQKNNSSTRRKNRRDFDQYVPSSGIYLKSTPSFRKSSERINSVYKPDSLSQIISNQTLSLEQLAKSQLRVIDGKINSLKGKYEISDFDEIKAFLSKKSYLISLLKEISSKIYQYFGSSQKLALQVIYESDFPEDSELWILVLTELPAKEARSIMNRFDKDWWLKNLHKAGCKLNVGIEYV